MTETPAAGGYSVRMANVGGGGEDSRATRMVVARTRSPGGTKGVGGAGKTLMTPNTTDVSYAKAWSGNDSPPCTSGPRTLDLHDE